MPIPSQNIGSTTPKSGTYQFTALRLQGLTLKIPDAAGVDSVSNRRLVSIQQDENGNLFAVVSPAAIADHTVVGYGALEEALQSGGISSISPEPNTFVDGDRVTVLRNPGDVYMLDVDPSNVPDIGIGTAYMDEQGRLSSSSSGSNKALFGQVYSAVPGLQLANQIAEDTLLFQMNTAGRP